MLILLIFFLLVPGSARAEESEGTEQAPCTEHQWKDAVCAVCGQEMFKHSPYQGRKDQLYLDGFADGITATEIVIPVAIDGKTIKVIASDAFRNCTSLTKVAFAEGSEVDWIGNSTFQDSGIESISIPASVTHIGSSAFYNCSSLTKVTFAENGELTDIRWRAFYGTAITSIDIPSTVKTIEENAFNSASLTTVNFSRIAMNGNIADYAASMFGDNTSLASITVPSGSEDLYKNLLADKASIIQGQLIHVGGLKYEMNKTKDGLVCKGFIEDVQKDVVIPAEVGACPVTTIGEKAFYATDIESVSIPASVSEIGSLAFGDCTSLASVAFGRIAKNGGLDGYQSDMFSGSSALASISVPGGSEESYQNLLNISDLVQGQVILADGLKYEVNEMKDGLVCVGFSADVKKEVTIPSEVQGYPVVAIGNQAFLGAAISGITIPSSIATIGDGAFSDCASLAVVTFGRISFLDQIDAYQSDMFAGCTALDIINLPSGCEETYKSQLNLGDYITLKAQEIVVGGLRYMLNDAKDGYECWGFSGDSWAKLVIPSQLGSYPVSSICFYAFRNNSVIESVSIPASLKRIDDSAFYNCSSLTTVTIEEGSKLAKIDNMAFAKTALQSISIPSSVGEIFGYAFWNCTSLSTVAFGRILMEDNFSSEPNMFDGCNSLSTIYVPRGCKEAYFWRLSCNPDYIVETDIVANGLKFEINEAKDGLNCTGFYDGDQETKAKPARVVVPAEVSACPVTGIGEGAFSQTAIERISIPSSVKTIASNAFADASSLLYVCVDGDAYEGYLEQTFDGGDKLVVMGKEQMLSDESSFSAVTHPTLYDMGNLGYSRSLETTGEYATLCLPFSLDLSRAEGVFEKVYVPMNTLIHHTKKSTAQLEHFILMLKEQDLDATIPAGQPMFVKLSDMASAFSLNNTTEQVLTADLQPKSETMTVVDWDGLSGLMTQNKQFSISYAGTFLPQQASEDGNLWTFNPNGTFGKQIEGTVYPFRLVLSVDKENGSDTGSESGSGSESPSAQAKQYVFSIGVTDGTTTGIREIFSSDDMVASELNASSRSGIIYDLNGRKVGSIAGTKSLGKGIYVMNGKKIVVK